MAGTSASGRRPVSPAIHAVRGTFKSERHDGFDAPEPPIGRPDPPEELAGMALREWERMLERLELTGALSKVDDMVVYQYCRLFAETEELRERQEGVENTLDLLESQLGEVEKEDKGSLLREIGKMTQLSAGFDNKIRQGRMALRQYLVEFGLTPASRARVKLPPKKQESKLDKFRKGA